MMVLVTGGAGTIGRSVIACLVSNGASVRALCAPGTDSSPASMAGALVVVGDATNQSTVESALVGADAVVHLAAIPHPNLGAPREVFANNVLSTFTVLSVAGSAGVARAVIASSINASGVNLNPHAVMPAYFPIDEELPRDIADAYSLSKSVDEQTAATAHRTWGIDVVALRFPLVRAHADFDPILAELSADPASMVRTGWSYLTAEDAAMAVWAALTVALAGANVIGLSAADTLLPVETARLLQTYAPEVPCRRTFHGREALVSTSRARRLLGFVPVESVHDRREYRL